MAQINANPQGGIPTNPPGQLGVTPPPNPTANPPAGLPPLAQAITQGAVPNSLGSPGPFGPSQAPPPGPAAGLSPQQPPPPTGALDPNSANPALSQALGTSPNSPLAQRIHQRFLQEEAQAQAASALKQAATGVNPVSGQPTVGNSYDPSQPGPYGFNPSVMAGAIPTGNVDVAALTDKARTSDWNFRNPDFAARFNGGGPVVDDRGPLTRSLTDGTTIAFPGNRVKRAGAATPEELAAMSPDVRRAVLARRQGSRRPGQR